MVPAMHKERLERSHQPRVTLILEPVKDRSGVYYWSETARRMRVGVMDLLNLPTSWYVDQRLFILGYPY